MRDAPGKQLSDETTKACWRYSFYDYNYTVDVLQIRRC